MLRARDVRLYWIATTGALAVIAIVAYLILTFPLTQDHLGYALPGPRGRLPSPRRFNGFSYATSATAQCLTARQVRGLLNPVHESLPLVQVGAIPVLLGLGHPYRLFRPTTSRGWTAIALFAERGHDCYQAYGVGGAPN